MIRWLIHQHHIVPTQHQLAVNHATLLATGQDLDCFFHIIAREQQASENRAHGLIIITFAGPFSHPIGERLVGRKFLGRILRHIPNIGILRPLDGTRIRRESAQIPAQATQQGGFTGTVFTNDGNLLTRLDRNTKVLEQSPVVRLGNPLGFHRQSM